ncbi:MAG: class I SAM-dependent methyltransferase, partial [Geminicoccaceae bacterium]
ARVAAHYGNPDLLKAILDGLEQAGGNPEALSLEDLAPVDAFHTAGRIATVKALAMTPITAGMHVLDAGSGIGGTARRLALKHGCRVTGIDLTPDYVAVARALTERTGQADACTFHQGTVLDMPFADDAFDAVVSFHVAMNIEDRAGLYGEIARVLRRGSSFCLYDVMKGPTPGMPYPVPWADMEANSILKTEEETCDLLRQAGFTMVDRASFRDLAIDFFHKNVAGSDRQKTVRPLGLHLLTGLDTRQKFANYAQALDQHRADPVVIVARLG